MIINSSQWGSFTEGNVTLYAAHSIPTSITPLDCYTPSAFAWVLYDKLTQTLTAARDYLGLEPFYYCYQNQTFVFGSTLPDVLKKLPTSPALNTTRLIEECFHDGKTLMTRYSNETHYKGVFRLDPGSRLHIKNGTLRHEIYWSFDSGAASLNYTHDNDYIDHFGELLNEIVLSQIQGHKNLVAEYSGGLDSTAVVTVCHMNQIKLPLFCHVGSESDNGGDFSFAECVIKHFNMTDVHYINADNFEPALQFQKLATIFAGVPPYIFAIMANNIYQAIAGHSEGDKLILSGFGGDQCVSSHASPKIFYTELLRQKQYRKAWQELLLAKSESTRIRNFLQFLRYRYPNLHDMLIKMGDVRRAIKSYLEESSPVIKAHKGLNNYVSLKEMNLDLLQGSLCHEVRMRVEYSAVLGKAMGFSFAYPLLHPKLIDFALRLPPLQQRRNGEGRYLMRQYLAQFVPEKNYKQDKTKGAHIMPAVMQKCKNYEKSEMSDDALKQLPFYDQIEKATTPHSLLRQKIYAYMFNSWTLDNGR